MRTVVLHEADEAGKKARTEEKQRRKQDNLEREQEKREQARAAKEARKKEKAEEALVQKEALTGKAKSTSLSFLLFSLFETHSPLPPPAETNPASLPTTTLRALGSLTVKVSSVKSVTPAQTCAFETWLEATKALQKALN